MRPPFIQLSRRPDTFRAFHEQHHAHRKFCQREVCQQIVDSGGDYLVIVKENQPTLRQNIETAFVETEAFSPLRAEGISSRTR